MKRFIIFSCDNLNGLQGAANFVKLLSDEAYWKEQGIQVKVYSNSHTFSDALEYQKTAKYKLRLFLKGILNKTNFGKRLKFYHHDLKVLGAKPVESVQDNISDKDWILLNDLYVADAFYRRFGNKKNTIFMMHNSGDFFSMIDYLFTDRRIKDYLINLEKLIYENATKIVFVSHKAKEEFEHRHPKYRNKTLHIYIGLKDINSNKTRFSGEKLKLITVGTVNKRKNQVAIIQAIKKIGNRNIELCIVGAGEELEKCKKVAVESNIENQIEFVGSQNDVVSFLDKSDIFVMASKDEGLPIAAQEALRAGMPLILTDVGGCAELIDGNGILIDKKAEKLAEAIRNCLDNRERLQEWSAKSRILYEENFSVNTMLEQYNKIING